VGKSSEPKMKDKYSKSFAVPVTISKLWFWWVLFGLSGGVIMCISLFWCLFLNPVLKNEEYRIIKENIWDKDINIVFQIIFTMMAIIMPIFVPFFLIFLIFLVLKDMIPAYFSKDRKYFLIFSYQGIDMAGYFFSWKSIKWIGARRISKSKVLLYWIIQDNKNGLTALQCPRIQPIPEYIFDAITVAVLDRFHRQTAHLNDNKSWIIYDSKFRFPEFVHTHDLFPIVSRKDITVDEPFNYDACSQDLK
jgi:hypothetical protein